MKFIYGCTYDDDKMYYQPSRILQVLKAVTSVHWMWEPPLYPLNITFMIANITWMEKKRQRAG